MAAKQKELKDLFLDTLKDIYFRSEERRVGKECRL